MKNKISAAVLKCHECELRREFEKHNERCSKYCSFGFYYTEKQAQRSRFVFLTQNPGLASSRSSEYQELDRPPEGDYVRIMQRQYAKWLMNKNPAFSKPFFAALKAAGLIKYDDLSEYLDRRFYEDFLVTDLVKCRANTSAIKDDHVDKCTEAFLTEELKDYGHGKLVFAFSSRTWGYLTNDRFSPKPVAAEGKPAGRMDRVSRVHGMLFRSDTLDAWIMPLAHFSQRQFNYYLRDSYFRYLKEGLKRYNDERNQ